ncbi:MAG TPA: hypothetical protein VM889_06635 [Candidatus Thermoplasmatota archaeon]|nr:hypothetical protein [Candidatus Thermoplasmatota archaeon]
MLPPAAEASSTCAPGAGVGAYTFSASCTTSGVFMYSTITVPAGVTITVPSSETLTLYSRLSLRVEGVIEGGRLLELVSDQVISIPGEVRAASAAFEDGAGGSVTISGQTGTVAGIIQSGDGADGGVAGHVGLPGARGGDIIFKTPTLAATGTFIVGNGGDGGSVRSDGAAWGGDGGASGTLVPPAATDLLALLQSGRVLGGQGGAGGFAEAGCTEVYVPLLNQPAMACNAADYTSERGRACNGGDRGPTEYGVPGIPGCSGGSIHGKGGHGGNGLIRGGDGGSSWTYAPHGGHGGRGGPACAHYSCTSDPTDSIPGGRGGEGGKGGYAKAEGGRGGNGLLYGGNGGSGYAHPGDGGNGGPGGNGDYLYYDGSDNWILKLQKCEALLTCHRNYGYPGIWDDTICMNPGWGGFRGSRGLGSGFGGQGGAGWILLGSNGEGWAGDSRIGFDGPAGAYRCRL